jgi:hypothetical protein
MVNKIKNLPQGLRTMRVANCILLTTISNAGQNKSEVLVKGLEDKFDNKFGELCGSQFFTNDEYDNFKEWSINSGFFQFQFYSHPEYEHCNSYIFTLWHALPVSKLASKK